MRKALLMLGYFADQDINWIITQGKKKSIGTEEILIKAGQPITDLYILVAGKLSIRYGHAEEKEIVVRHPGEIVGELSFLDSRAPTETVVAANSVTLIAIDRNTLADHLKSDIAFAARFYQALGVMLASRFRQTMGQLTLRQDGNELDTTVADELDPDLLDHMALAGQRFELMRSHFLAQK